MKTLRHTVKLKGKDGQNVSVTMLADEESDEVNEYIHRFEALGYELVTHKKRSANVVREFLHYASQSRRMIFWAGWLGALVFINIGGWIVRMLL